MIETDQSQILLGVHWCQRFDSRFPMVTLNRSYEDRAVLWDLNPLHIRASDGKSDCPSDISSVHKRSANVTRRKKLTKSDLAN